jgi:hypothetical protein
MSQVVQVDSETAIRVTVLLDKLKGNLMNCVCMNWYSRQIHNVSLQRNIPRGFQQFIGQCAKSIFQCVNHVKANDIIKFLHHI